MFACPRKRKITELTHQNAFTGIVQSIDGSAFVYVRRVNDTVYISASERDNGDAEVPLTLTQCRDLMALIEVALAADPIAVPNSET